MTVLILSTMFNFACLTAWLVINFDKPLHEADWLHGFIYFAIAAWNSYEISRAIDRNDPR